MKLTSIDYLLAIVTASVGILFLVRSNQVAEFLYKLQLPGYKKLYGENFLKKFPYNLLGFYKAVIPLAGVFALLFAYGVLFGPSGVMKINDIRANVGLIDQVTDYKLIKLNDEEFLEHTTDGGGELTGYFKDNKIHKIVERVGLSYGVIRDEYYFIDSQLILVKEKEEVFPYVEDSGTLDHAKLETTFESSYYFNSGEIIHIESSGMRRFSEDTKPEDYIKMTTKYIELLSKSK